METNLLDRMLTAYQTDQTPVTITLQNKIQVSGKVLAFDSYILLMDGQRRSVVYRHAISCISTHSPEKQKLPAPARKQASLPSAALSARPAKQKPRRHPPEASLSAAADEQSINNSMKEGLLKWMREQKAAR